MSNVAACTPAPTLNQAKASTTTHSPGTYPSGASTAGSGLSPQTEWYLPNATTEITQPILPSAPALSRPPTLNLPGVTLVLIETQENELGALALRDCLRNAAFGEVLIFTNSPECYVGLGRTIPVPNWDSKLGWSEFSWHGVVEHLKTPHALYIQWDSWIIDPAAWREEFLRYDIVGAPWWYEENNVGGLGFSLRSKRILQFLTDHRDEFPIITDFDDDLICRRYRQRLEAAGFVWAPQELAWDFAFECMRPPNVLQRHFGFHGIGNWPLVLPWERLQERVRIVRKSEYLKYSGHMSSLADLLIRYATDHQQRIENLNANANEAHYFSAINRLRSEDYTNGLPAYEVRWKTKWFEEYQAIRATFAQHGVPQWYGEPLDGKTIIVWHEQGHGDSVIMQRYLPLLEERAGTVLVGVPDSLVPLFKANGHLAFNTIPDHYSFNYHCPFYSLPFAFGTQRESVPPPCLRAPKALPKLRRIPGRPLVGIYWHANSKFPHNDHRSMTFAQMRKALNHDCDYVALQYDLDEAGTSWNELRDYSINYVPFEDFGELASLIDEVDLVVCVCSGIANIAGSLRKPMWVMLSADRFRDMRWGKAGNPSPWYPTARIFRQIELDDWDSVTAEVFSNLSYERVKYG